VTIDRIALSAPGAERPDVRIGIDGRELCGQPTGVGRYLAGLLAEWSRDELARRHEFVLYAHRPLDLPLDGRRFSTREVPGAGRLWWEQRLLPRVARRDHLDVFFAPGYTAPLFLRCRRVVTIHDVSFAAHPEWFGWREGLRRRVMSRRAAAAADAVITDSQFSRREIVERLGAPEGRVHVVLPGITRDEFPGTSDTTSRPAEVVLKPDATSERILYVGSIFNRRHVPELIRGFAALARRRPTVRLDLVGDNRTYPRQDLARTIAAEGLDGRAVWRQYVPDPELQALYGSARAFVFLSEYEGFGLTPLEALAAGVPPLLLDTAVAREICGDAALYVSRGDSAAVADAMERLLFDAGTRDAIMSCAAAVLARYSWPRAARETLAILEGVVRS
jgi:glycosyltransferase involved in cell wall biosynthesis